MKIFNTSTIREWDRYTIQQQYANSSELMDFAAAICVTDMEDTEFHSSYVIFCGTGNNGGDGLCMAMIFASREIPVTVHIVGDPENGSPDFRLNMQRIIESEITMKFLSETDNTFDLDPASCVIDCIFGTGLNRPVEGWIAELIDRINAHPNHVISIDVPSGMMPDELGPQPPHVIEADRTLTFEIPKRAMLFEENYKYVGTLSVLDLGLDTDFEEAQESDLVYYEQREAHRDFIQRKKYVHKHQLGHARIIAGSKGKIGAAVLCATACARSGPGLVTVNVPACGYPIIQTTLPEAMCEADTGENDLCSVVFDTGFSATAIGPGIGESPETTIMLRKFLKDATHPLVLDADALNIIAKKNLHDQIPKMSVITPHVGEFDRLFGKHSDSFTRFETLKKKSVELGIVIVLKGPHTATATPDGMVYFNSTGNQGMATAGSGDVLTGIICGLLAQKYQPAVAARLGVFIHGNAGDHAMRRKAVTGMIAGDIITHLNETWHQLEDLIL